MREIVKDLNGAVNITDDVLVFGVGKENFQNSVFSFLDLCRKVIVLESRQNTDRCTINNILWSDFNEARHKDGP